MRRREFIVTLLNGAAAAWPLTVRAQAPATPVIGYFSARSPESDVPMLAAFRQGLNESGYVEGRNVAIEYRWGVGQYDRLSGLAEDLVRRQVAVIVTGGGEIAALAAKKATAKIPIVFNIGGDPVQFGLVASLRKPGGNLTGVTSFLFTLGTKQLGLLRQLAPTGAVIAFLVNPNDPGAGLLVTETQEAARAIGQQLLVLRAATEGEIDAAFATLVQQRAGALLVAASPLFATRAEQL